MDRRNFLRAAILAGAAFTVKESGAMTVVSQQLNAAEPGSSMEANAMQAGASSGRSGNYDLVAVMGGEPVEMFRKGIAEMGGMGRYVKKGQKVCVKPNIGWDKAPEMAANTNPLLVAEIVRQCLAAGASEVTVFDHTCDDWRKCYSNSGIEEAAKKAGAKVVPADQESYYKPVSIAKAKILKSTKIHEAILNADVWINVPVLKNHGGAKMSISMKNLMGIVWDRGFFHKNDLQQCIADISSLERRPALNVVDAYRLMKTNGPRGRSEADVVNSKALFLSQDMVAVDTAATNFFNQVREMPLTDVGHLSRGESIGVGTMKLDTLKIKRVKI
ncbi:MAG: tat (twin-arginine translocation) pathway signal sequence [Paludibacter sp. 47-17]|nr:MAG: tat (twin-arginine translocation) pathway signal sequence [Paludibacter sp. SCN 50-10]ODU61894.1 MAG: tat (twin-arginine translocation) pathway signal sequence [Paludibacter sp. SCN 51-9]OJX91099.1 MAG: tat (twin-arginine translocation) pathway signal sequence [Paludibacter sp. 47-17]